MRKKQQLSIGPCKSLPNSPSHSSVPAASIPSVHINQVRSKYSQPTLKSSTWICKKSPVYVILLMAIACIVSEWVILSTSYFSSIDLVLSPLLLFFLFLFSFYYPLSSSFLLLFLWFCRFVLISLAPQAANGGGAFSDYSSSVPSTPSISQREMRIETIAASNTPTPIRKQSKRRSNIFTVSMRQLMQSNTHSHY